MLIKNNRFKNRDCSSLNVCSFNTPKYITNTFNNYITNNLNMNTNDQQNKNEKDIQEIHIANFFRILEKKNRDNKLLKLKNYCSESYTDISNTDNNINFSKNSNSTQNSNFYGGNTVYCKKNCKPFMYYPIEKKNETINIDNYSNNFYSPKIKNKNENIYNYGSTNITSSNKLNNVYDECKSSPFNLDRVYISSPISPRNKNIRNHIEVNILNRSKKCQSSKNIVKIKEDFTDFNKKIEDNNKRCNEEYLKLIYELEKENKTLKEIIKGSIKNKDLIENNSEKLVKCRKNQQSNIKGKIIDEKIRNILINRTSENFYKRKNENKCMLDDNININKNLMFKFTNEPM